MYVVSYDFCIPLCWCCRSCVKGEQVFLSYGPLPNLKLLLFYAFVLQDNPQDVASFTLQACNLMFTCTTLNSLYWRA